MAFTKFLNRYKIPLTICLSTKIFLLIFSFFAFQLFTKQEISSISQFLEIWNRWDGPHYIEIAENWYQTSGEPSLFIVFFPLYPLLIKLTNFLINDFSTSAILVSLIFSFIATIALFELVLLDFGKKVAYLSVWFLNIYPLAYFLQASYTESLFLSVSLLTIYFYRKKFNIISGTFGIFSTLTRVNAMLLLPLLLFEIKNFKKDLLSLIILPFGFLVYLGINFSIYGNFFHFIKPLQENWYKNLDYPWNGIRNLMNSIPHFKEPNFYIYFSEIVAILFITIMTIVVFIKVRKSYALFMFLNLLLVTSTNFILSTPRYSLSLFPIFISLGLIKNKFALLILSLIFIPLLAFFTHLYVQGKWAF